MFLNVLFIPVKKLFQLFENYQNNLSKIEDDCSNYVAESVARKFIHKHPHLGQPENGPSTSNSWIECISKGNLIHPSNALIEIANILENIFNKYHGQTSLNKLPGKYIGYLGQGAK